MPALYLPSIVRILCRLTCVDASFMSTDHYLAPCSRTSIQGEGKITKWQI